MSVIALFAVAALAATPPSTLILEKVRSVDDPRGVELRDDVKGDRGVPLSCALVDNTTVNLVRGKDATLEVARGGAKRSVVVENVRGVGRSTLGCGEGDDFYYANPRLGRLLAYSANRLFRGEDPVVWTRQVEPFRNMDEAGGVMTDTSVATVLQVRQRLVLVEWLYRKDGETSFWHEVLDGATGATLGKLGPSDLLVKTNERDPWWIVFQGGGNEVVNYVPQNVFRIRFGPLAEGARSAADTIAQFPKDPPPQRLRAVAKLSPNPVINHMISLLTPTRTSTNAVIEFCPTVPAQRARYWLGSEYDEELGTVARNTLLSFWADRQASGANGNPIDTWFQAEIASHDPMKTLLAHFNPHEDAWVAAYQQALLTLGGPTLEQIFEKYGAETGAVTRIPSGRQSP